MSSSLTLASFEPLVGQVFQAEWNGTVCELRLVNAKPLPAYRDAPRKDPFSLLFRGTASLGQGSAALDHSELGKLELFLVPVGKEQEDMFYEAVFN